METVDRIDRIVKCVGRVVTIGAGQAAQAAADLMREHKVGCVVVLNDEGKVVGILTERDVITRVVARAADPAETRVSEVMTRKVVSCTPATTTGEAQQLMVTHKVRHLPIIRDGRPKGMISSRDVVAFQLSNSLAMMAAAEQVARLTKNLKFLEFDELVELATREVPKIFRAKMAALCFPQGGCPMSISPLVRRRGCLCPEGELAARAGDGQSGPNADTVFGDVTAPCDRLGGSRPR